MLRGPRELLELEKVSEDGEEIGVAVSGEVEVVSEDVIEGGDEKTTDAVSSVQSDDQQRKTGFSWLSSLFKVFTIQKSAYASEKQKGQLHSIEERLRELEERGVVTDSRLLGLEAEVFSQRRELEKEKAEYEAKCLTLGIPSELSSNSDASASGSQSRRVEGLLPAAQERSSARNLLLRGSL